jgi:hypothetical protein
MLNSKFYWLDGFLSLLRLAHQRLGHPNQHFEFAYDGFGQIGLYAHS